MFWDLKNNALLPEPIFSTEEPNVELALIVLSLPLKEINRYLNVKACMVFDKVFYLFKLMLNKSFNILPSVG